MSLALLNVGRSIPGEVTMSSLGSPAQIAYCFADCPDGPLPPLHLEFDANRTVAIVQKCEGPHNVVDHSATPEGLLRAVAAVAATAGGNNAFYPTDLIVVLNPEHAALLTRAGWGRDEIRAYLWEQARNDRAALLNRGMRSRWADEWSEWDRIPVVPDPSRIWVVGAGRTGSELDGCSPLGTVSSKLALRVSWIESEPATPDR